MFHFIFGIENINLNYHSITLPYKFLMSKGCIIMPLKNYFCVTLLFIIVFGLFICGADSANTYNKKYNLA